MKTLNNNQKQKSVISENRKTRKRKSVPRLQQNTDLISLKLLHKNDYWKAIRSTELSNKKFKCQRCLRSFDTRTELHQHMDDVSSLDNLFGCQVCEEKFRSKEDLVHHLGHDHQPEKFRCFLCRSPTEFCVSNHTDYLYSVREKNFDCPGCEKEFTTLNSLKRHKRKK